MDKVRTIAYAVFAIALVLAVLLSATSDLFSSSLRQLNSLGGVSITAFFSNHCLFLNVTNNMNTYLTFYNATGPGIYLTRVMRIPSHSSGVLDLYVSNLSILSRPFRLLLFLSFAGVNVTTSVKI
ncbi:hypothetical protein HS7_00050 [Sulfolobales archaeon HS-7]|nr:hypothetical protein HS7_00050 [Sulfolobales archaeon HS-7]